MLISIILIIFQLIVLSLIIICLPKKHTNNNNYNTSNKTVGIVIPFRNEEDNLPLLLKNLIEQEYSKDKIQVVLVNDHSTDNSSKIVADFIKNNSIKNFKLLNLPKNIQGKKQAVISGLNKLNTDIIIHTDADVVVSKLWIKSIVSFFNNNTSELVLMPVFYKSFKQNISLSQSIQILETNILSAITKISAVCFKKPLMANAANMAYTSRLKEYFIASYNNLSSGDDMFFLEYCIAKNVNIKYFDNKNVYVYTSSEHNFKQFLAQRIRWAGKNKKLNNVFAKFVGISFFIINILWISILFTNKTTVFTLYGFKVFTEFVLNYYIINYFKLSKQVLLNSTIFSFWYPFYIVLVTVLSLFVSPKWKGRKINNLSSI